MLVMDARVSPGLWAPEVPGGRGDPRKGRQSRNNSHSGSPRRGMKEQEQGRQGAGNKKRVSFFETVLVCETHGKHEYDRTAVEVAELAREDIQEVLEMRIAFLRQTPPPPPLPLPAASSPARRLSTPAFSYSSPATSYHASARPAPNSSPSSSQVHPHTPLPTSARAKTSEASWSPPSPTSPESSDWSSIAAVLSRPSVADPLERPAGPVPGRGSPGGRAGVPWERERESGVAGSTYTGDAERNWSSPAAFVTPRPRPPLPPHFPGQVYARTGSGSGRTWDERRAATGYEAWGVDVGAWASGGGGVGGGVGGAGGVGQMWDGRGAVGSSGDAPHYNTPPLARPTPTSASATSTPTTTSSAGSSLPTPTSATPSPTQTRWSPPSPPSSPETSAAPGEGDISSGGESEVESGEPSAKSGRVGGVGDQ